MRLLRSSKWLRVAALLAVIAIAVLPVTSAFAVTIPQPDSPIQILAVDAWTLADGQVGVLVEYYIYYASPPTTPATQTYLAAFYDAVGAQVEASAPYSYHTNGYGTGLIWIQLSLADVAAHSISQASMASYSIKLMGNPSQTWAGGTIPSVNATIGTWPASGDPTVLLAQKVLFYAGTAPGALGSAWAIALEDSTSYGYKLNAAGTTYFTGTIPSLQVLAPSVFAISGVNPTPQVLDYTTAFGATATGVVLGSPVTLTAGSTNLTVTGAGQVVFVLTQGTSGNITSPVVAGSPIQLPSGTDNITTTGAGWMLVNVYENNLAAQAGAQVTGTGFDLTALANILHMSRLFLSTIVWLILGVIVSGGVYLGYTKNPNYNPYSGDAGKTVMLVFSLWCIGGTIMGMFHPIVGALLFMGSGAAMGYIFFFRYTADIGRTVMFLAWMFVITAVAGNVVMGQTAFTRNHLTTNITATTDTLTVANTTGFPVPGIVQIDNEQIAYSDKDATHLMGKSVLGVPTQPLVRGANGTTADSHDVNAVVSTIEGAMANTAMNYNITVIASTSGVQDFISTTTAVFALLGSIIFLPLTFLGSDLMIITVLWACIGIGLLISVTVALAGGRTVSV